ncbi:Putative inner membrane protein YqgA [Salmonella enterica subsp. arizonae]|uniref:Inner membrane protein YqgA n=1 Tax=Salmonella enterica subsp. arizonae TaxID=59203 RepID=A0A379T670_SALER|nr:Putative inner membrane protein YqgA [Salmonella enterica subsp. arizonae]
MKCANLPVMVLATLVGALIGEFCLLEKGINGAVAKIQQLFMISGNKPTHDSFIQSYVAIIVLFCASGTGIFGAMHEGMTGDPNILIAKSFLDFFTAIIFACSLGIAVSAICAPMLIIQLALAACATLILPLTTPGNDGRL